MIICLSLFYFISLLDDFISILFYLLVIVLVYSIFFTILGRVFDYFYYCYYFVLVCFVFPPFHFILFYFSSILFYFLLFYFILVYIDTVCVKSGIDTSEQMPCR